MNYDPLDDHLSKYEKWNSMRFTRNLLKHIREAYPIGVPALIAKSITDRIKQDAGYNFFFGTPIDNLRRIASWVITSLVREKKIDHIIMLCKGMWDRYGREDLVTAGLILANHPSLNSNELWKIFATITHNKKFCTAEGLLHTIEEMKKAKRNPPKNEILFEWLNSRGVLQKISILILHVNQLEVNHKTKSLLNSITVNTSEDLIKRVIKDILK